MVSSHGILLHKQNTLVSYLLEEKGGKKRRQKGRKERKKKGKEGETEAFMV